MLRAPLAHARGCAYYAPIQSWLRLCIVKARRLEERVRISGIEHARVMEHARVIEHARVARRASRSLHLDGQNCILRMATSVGHHCKLPAAATAHCLLMSRSSLTVMVARMA